jgi:hypothetical protein
MSSNTVRHLITSTITTLQTLHYTSPHFTTLHPTTLHYTSPNYTSLHFTQLHFTTLHHTSLHFTTLHYTSPHFTQLHVTTLHYTSPHFTTLHYTSLPLISTRRELFGSDLLSPEATNRSPVKCPIFLFCCNRIWRFCTDFSESPQYQIS